MKGEQVSVIDYLLHTHAGKNYETHSLIRFNTD